MSLLCKSGTYGKPRFIDYHERLRHMTIFQGDPSYFRWPLSVYHFQATKLPINSSKYTINVLQCRNESTEKNCSRKNWLLLYLYWYGGSLWSHIYCQITRVWSERRKMIVCKMGLTCWRPVEEAEPYRQCKEQECQNDFKSQTNCSKYAGILESGLVQL